MSEPATTTPAAIPPSGDPLPDPAVTSTGTDDEGTNEPEPTHIPSDFAAKHLNAPADLDYKDTLLGYRLAYNIKMQSHNIDNLSLSLRHMTDPVAFPQPGKPQEAYYGYSPVELFSFANDPRFQKFHENLMGDAGLPQHLLAAISAYRLNPPPVQPSSDTSTSTAPKEKLKTTPSWKHSVPSVKLTPLIVATRPSLTFPNEYLFAAKNLVPIPLVILRTSVIEDFINKHSSIPMKKRNAPAPTDEGKANTLFFIDNDALYKKFGDDNTTNVPYHAWCDAMENFLQIIEFLCDDNDNTWYENWRQHVYFFKKLNKSAENYEVWFPLERDFAKQIRAHAAFNVEVYTAREFLS
ncbi:hypothetical protein FISHEDRAFT_54957 [Fistulina hepatica ATCC 64428]|uniref:Uncharacterized protein n=1 Tax=Fistulina hepatica ATCC 64428 TaxID=1128425 RepID=A0A0D7ASI3_9AGAR|nr:hypothetical protein FISHEDRAFT_54957 [Fistulina hepatica ATCC 64428]